MSTLDDLLRLHRESAPEQSQDDAFGELVKKALTPVDESRTIGGTAKDVGITAIKVAIGLPEAAVGLADIFTGGRVGKGLEDVGYRPAEAKSILDDLYSPAQQAANQKVQDADGFIGKVGAALENPSVIGHTVLESLPAMAAGGLAARGLARVAPKAFSVGVDLAGKPIAGAGAAAVGEGIMGAGMAAEGIRAETSDGYLTPKQALLAGATGVTTAGFGALGNKLAGYLKIGDVDTLIAGGRAALAGQTVNATGKQKNALRRFVEGAFTEGVLEELPQSVSEQVLQNVALGKDLMEGVDYAAAMGLLAGAAMGGPVAALAGGGRADQAPTTPPGTGPQPAPAGPPPASGQPLPPGPQPVQPPPAGPLGRAANMLPAMAPVTIDAEVLSPQRVPVQRGLEAPIIDAEYTDVTGQIGQQGRGALPSGQGQRALPAPALQLPAPAIDANQPAATQAPQSIQEPINDLSPVQQPRGEAGQEVQGVRPQGAVEAQDGAKIQAVGEPVANEASLEQQPTAPVTPLPASAPQPARAVQPAASPVAPAPSVKPQESTESAQIITARGLVEGKRKPAQLFTVTDQAAKMGGYVFARDHKGALSIIKPNGSMTKASEAIANRVFQAEKAQATAPFTLPQKPVASQPLNAAPVASQNRPEVSNKQPWQMTRKAYLGVVKARQYSFPAGQGPEFNAMAKQQHGLSHRNAVEQAVKAGHPVPAEVLADYPDLASQKPSKPSAKIDTSSANVDDNDTTGTTPPPAGSKMLKEPYQPAAGEIVKNDGSLFKIEKGARMALVSRGLRESHEIAKVEGGFVIRPTAKTQEKGAVSAEIAEVVNDPRLKRKAYRELIADFVAGNTQASGSRKEAGEFVGQQIRNEYGEVVGRVPSPNMKELQPAIGMAGSVEALRNAVQKAAKGEKLGIAQARAVKMVLDVMSDQRRQVDNNSRRNLLSLIRARAGRQGLIEQDAPKLTDEDFRDVSREEYPEDWDAETNTLADIAESAKAVLGKDTVYDILDSSKTDSQIAAELYAAIAQEKANGRKGEKGFGLDEGAGQEEGATATEEVTPLTEQTADGEQVKAFATPPTFGKTDRDNQAGVSKNGLDFTLQEEEAGLFDQQADGMEAFDAEIDAFVASQPQENGVKYISSLEKAFHDSEVKSKDPAQNNRLPDLDTTEMSWEEKRKAEVDAEERVKSAPRGTWLVIATKSSEGRPFYRHLMSDGRGKLALGSGTDYNEAPTTYENAYRRMIEGELSRTVTRQREQEILDGAIAAAKKFKRGMVLKNVNLLTANGRKNFPTMTIEAVNENGTVEALATRKGVKGQYRVYGIDAVALSLFLPEDAKRGAPEAPGGLFDGPNNQAEAKGEPKAEPFDSKAWNKERDDRIKQSKEAGNTHLDQVTPAVETMLGKKIYNVHDLKEKGVVRTVSNRGDVVVHWSDNYSAEKNLATEKQEKRGNKTVPVFESWLMPSDLKDYVFESAEKPAEAPAKITPEKAVKIAADDVSKLRKADVFRVLDTYKDNATAIGNYITENRPDLANEVDEVLSEINAAVGEAGGKTPARFEAGAALTKGERKQVLATLTDVYKANNLEMEERIDGRGETYWAWPHRPEYFEKSDVTGAMVRFYVTLPDGKIAHPSELFPEMTQAKIDSQLVEQAVKQKQEDASNKEMNDRADKLANEDRVKARLAYIESQTNQDQAARNLVEFYSEQEGKWFATQLPDRAAQALADRGYKRVTKYRQNPNGKWAVMEYADGSKPEVTGLPTFSPDDLDAAKARAGYAHTSNRPGDRAKMEQESYVAFMESLRDDAMKDLPEGREADLERELARAKAEYLRRRYRVFSVRANTVSVQLAGSSKFNSKQAEQRGNALDKAEKDFSDWMEKTRKELLSAVGVSEVRAEKAGAKAKAKEEAKAVLAKREREARNKELTLPVINEPGGHAITKEQWSKVSKDYKSIVTSQDGTYRYRSMMVNGGLSPVFLTDAPVKEKPGKAKAEAQAPESAAPSSSQITTVAEFNDFRKRLNEGTLSIDDFKALFASILANKQAVTDDLNKLSKDGIFEKFPGLKYRWKNEKKGDVVDAAYRAFLSVFNISDGFISYGMGKNSYENVLQAKVDKYTQDDLDRHAAEVKASEEESKKRVAEMVEAVKDPKTLNDFIDYIRLKKSQGMTYADARMSLTVEQRAKFDELAAEDSRSKRKDRRDEQRDQVRTADQKVSGQIIETKHTQKGYDLFVVQLSERVSREDYTTLNTAAKRLGGYYSSFRGRGAVPGFQFRTREEAEAFAKLAEGDNSAAQEAVKTRRDAFEDDRSQSAVERLTTMAEAMDERADAIINADRKTNTARRARMAASAEAAAEKDKAMAQTMRNIANAIESGAAKFLDRVRQKVQVELLTSVVNRAQDKMLREKYPAWADQEQHKGDRPTAETADFAEWPTYTMYRSDWAKLARQMLDVDGLKKTGQRILSVADDVSDAYLKFAKDNLWKVATFVRKDGGFATFASKDEAERSIARSGYKGQAVVLPVKRGENVIIMSPSMAKERGVWQGDDDARITIIAELGDEVVTKLSKKSVKGIDLPWQLEIAKQRLDAFKRMGIETPQEMRTALREFIGLKQAVKAPDRVKELEREMVGRVKDGLDFFPTPQATADAMIEAAEIEEGMAVLEPSAGMGHIAERIREAGVEPDVIELSGKRRELLEAKGFKLVESDFMEMDPRGFTYGDLYEAPDGTRGIMSGSGGMGSSRVGLKNENGERIGWFDRDELKPIEKRGSSSGYDRIIMNPPFSDRRDAEHVRHAFDLLKPGGRLVAIMGEGVFFGQDKKAQEFREWLDSVDGTSEKLEEGTFNDPSLPVNTSVNARMVVIDKPEGSATRFSVGEKGGSDFGGFSFPTKDPAEMAKEVERLHQRVAHLEEVFGPIVAKWRNKPALKVVLDENGLPIKIRREIREARAQGRVRGVFIDGSTVYLVAANLPTDSMAEAVMMHEAIGHYGARALFGKNYQRAMGQLFLALGGKRGIETLAGRYGIDLSFYLAQDGKLSPEKFEQLAVDELLAHLIENNVKPTIVQKIIGAIRSGLKALGFKLDMNDADLLRILGQMKNAVVKGEGGTVIVGDTRFAASDNRKTMVKITTVEPFEGENIRQQANDYYSENIQGNSVENQQLGRVDFTKAGRGKVLSSNSDPRRMAVIKGLMSAVENAYVFYREADSSGRHGIEGVVHLLSPVSIDGETYALRIVVRDNGESRGKRFYTFFGYELEPGPIDRGFAADRPQGKPGVKSAPFPGGRSAEPLPTKGSSDSAISLTDLMAAVKGDIKFSVAPKETVIAAGKVNGTLVGDTIHLDIRVVDEESKQKSRNFVRDNRRNHDKVVLNLVQRFNAGDLVTKQLETSISDFLGEPDATWKEFSRRGGTNQTLSELRAERESSAAKLGQAIGQDNQGAPEAGKSRESQIAAAWFETAGWAESTRDLGQFVDAALTELENGADEKPVFDKVQTFIKTRFANDPSITDALLSLEADHGIKPVGKRAFIEEIAGLYRAWQQPAAEGGESRFSVSQASNLSNPVFDPQRVRDVAASIFDSAGTNVSWWQKSVGTMYHLAEELAKKGKPQFKAVFDKGQDFLSDISRIAMKAESLAPNIFPKTGIGQGLFKHLSRKDAEAISKALFAGTTDGEGVMDGVVYSDAELRRQFGLTEKQIGLYREARAAVDQSLDDITASFIARYAKDAGVSFDTEMDAADMAADVTAQIQELVGNAEAALEQERDAVAAAIERAGDNRAVVRQINSDFARFERDQTAFIDLNNTRINKINELAEKSAGLKKAGYFPLMRFGNHTVTMRDAEGNVLYFSMHESKAMANLEAKRLQRLNPENTVDRGQMSRKQAELYAGLNLEALELFAEHLGADEAAVYQEYLKKAVNNRSVMKRMIQRQGTAGYSEDAVRTLASFIVSNARHASSQLHLSDMRKLADDIKEGDIKDQAISLWQYLSKPQEEASALRGYLFFHYLGGSIASALTNMTQPVMMTAPYLAQFASPGKVVKALTAAARLSARKAESVEGQLGAALRRAEAAGIVAPQEIHQLTAMAANRLFSSNPAVNTALKAWGGLFSIAEIFNRRVTFIAAFDLATERGDRNPYEAAVKAVNETQGLYNRGNRANWGRGIVGAPLFTFKQFSVMYLELFKRLPLQQKLLMLGILALAGGAEGLPFKDDLDDLIDTLMQWAGFAWNTKAETRRAAESVLGKTGADIALRGVSAVLPLDVHGRLGMGNLLPGTSILKQSTTDKGRDVQDFFGPTGALLASASDALSLVATGQPVEAARAALPRAGQAFFDGGKAMQTGYLHDKRGRRTLEVAPSEALLKFMGFNPQRVATESEIKSMQMQDVALIRVRREEIINRWKNGIINKDREEISEARAMLTEWNRKNPEMKIRIKPETVLARAKAAQMSSRARYTKAIPVAQRQRMLNELE